MCVRVVGESVNAACERILRQTNARRAQRADEHAVSAPPGCKKSITLSFRVFISNDMEAKKSDLRKNSEQVFEKLPDNKYAIFLESCLQIGECVE